MSEFTHLSETGAAKQVDVSSKKNTLREAKAEGFVKTNKETMKALIKNQAPKNKGEIWSTARIAGIMAAKKTSDLIPLCHQVPIAGVEIEFETIPAQNAVRIIASCKANYSTGIEMEAICAVTISAVTIYDMIKGQDRSARIEGIRLLEKSGGKSGQYKAP